MFLLYKTETDDYYPDIDYKDNIKEKINNAYEDLYLWLSVN